MLMENTIALFPQTCAKEQISGTQMSAVLIKSFYSLTWLAHETIKLRGFDLDQSSSGFKSRVNAQT